MIRRQIGSSLLTGKWATPPFHQLGVFTISELLIGIDAELSTAADVLTE